MAMIEAKRHERKKAKYSVCAQYVDSGHSFMSSKTLNDGSQVTVSCLSAFSLHEDMTIITSLTIAVTCICTFRFNANQSVQHGSDSWYADVQSRAAAATQS